jgi:uncharacterized protein
VAEELETIVKKCLAMTKLKQTIIDELNQARKAQDREKRDALVLIASAIKQIEVDERIEIDDERMLVILNKMAKQRLESIAMFKDRPDLLQKEQFELDCIKKYLPEPLSDTAIAEIVTATLKEIDAKSQADMGRIMTALRPKLQGKADMAKVSALVKAALS